MSLEHQLWSRWRSCEAWQPVECGLTSSSPRFSRNTWSAYEVAPRKKLSTALACQNLHTHTQTDIVELGKDNEARWDILVNECVYVLLIVICARVIFCPKIQLSNIAEEFCSFHRFIVCNEGGTLYLKEESAGSFFMTDIRRVNKPFFPSHTRFLENQIRKNIGRPQSRT